MAGLLILTYAISGLVSLHHDLAVDKLSANGPETLSAIVRVGAFNNGLQHVIEHGHQLTAELLAIHHAGFCAAAHPDLADRVQAYPIPVRRSVPAQGQLEG
jgi:hypothetical protein